MTIYPFQAMFPRLDLTGNLFTFCERAKDDFPTRRDEGVYQFFEQPAVYVYQIETPARTHTGLVALNDIRDFSAGKVKKHEKTLTAREEQYHELLREWRAMIKPVLLTFAPNPAISEAFQQVTVNARPNLEADFPEDHQVHRIWAVTDPATIAHLQDLFANQLHDTYIADGHHRTTTTANLYEQFGSTSPEGLDFSRLFCAWFDAGQLDILDFNRVVAALDDLSADALLEKIRQSFRVELLPALRKPTHKHEITMWLNGQAWALHWTPDPADTSVILDVTVLNEYILTPHVGISDVRTDKRISYVEGSKGTAGIEAAVAANPARLVGFMLYPVAFADMVSIADQGGVMPPKSTYFEPRMKSGLLVQGLDTVQ